MAERLLDATCPLQLCDRKVNESARPRRHKGPLRVVDVQPHAFTGVLGQEVHQSAFPNERGRHIVGNLPVATA